MLSCLIYLFLLTKTSDCREKRTLEKTSALMYNLIRK